MNNEKKPFVPKTATDFQKLKLDRLMANPNKPVIIPDLPKERKGYNVPEFVRNVMGSSAGAGSGEFHVYRHLRRKEYTRQKMIEERSEQEKLDMEFQEKLLQNQKKSEERTAKKRAQRQRRKENLKRLKALKAAGKLPEKQEKKETSSDESSENENSEDEDDTTNRVVPETATDSVEIQNQNLIDKKLSDEQEKNDIDSNESTENKNENECDLTNNEIPKKPPEIGEAKDQSLRESFKDET